MELKLKLSKEVIALALIALAIISLSIFFRTTMLFYYGFYEPDGFWHFSVVRAAVDNHFIVPSSLSISGYPVHANVTEAKGLYYLSVLPYEFVGQFVGLSYYTIMRWLPVAFALLDMFGAYLLSRYLSKDKLLGLLTIAFVGFSMGNSARTSALIYRGDTFVTFPLIIALVLFIEVFRQETEKKKLIFAIAAGAALVCSNLVWNGSSFADITFVFAFIVLMVAAFIFRKDAIIKDGKYILLSILVWYVLALTAHGLSFILGQQFVDPTFIPVFIGIVALWGAIYYISHNMPDIMRSFTYRTGLILGGIIVGVLAFALLEPGIVYNVFVGNGFVQTAGSFGSTIQELQPPTYEFLYTSFGMNIYMTLPTLAMAIPTYFGVQPFLWNINYGVLGIILMLLLSIPYLFMQIYDSGGFMNGNARIRHDLSVPMVVVLAYLVLTGYLQMHIIRFNSLVSIPIAVLGAFTIYWMITYMKDQQIGSKTGMLFMAAIFVIILLSIDMPLQQVFAALFQNPLVVSILSMLFAFIAALLSILLFYTKDSKYQKAVAGGLIVFSIIFAYAAISPYSQFSQYKAFLLPLIALPVLAVIQIAMDKKVNLWYAVFLMFVFYSILYYDNVYSAGLVQADSINYQFIDAMQWLKANSSPSSVVLTLWPDGSVVEGVANRTSITDSVGSQNGFLAQGFARWILNGSDDPQFVTGHMSDKPNYLVVRTPWLIETQGIYVEANLTAVIPKGATCPAGYVPVNITAPSNDTSICEVNEGLYGYQPLPSFEEQTVNATSKRLIFATTQGQYPIVITNFLYAPTGGLSGIASFVQLNQTSILPFSSVTLYDQDNGNYTTVQQNQFNETNGQSLVIEYSGVPRQNFFLNTTGAYVFASSIAQSNMYKFLFECGSVQCAWDNNVSTMHLVYINPDTRIFAISYSS